MDYDAKFPAYTVVYPDGDTQIEATQLVVFTDLTSSIPTTLDTTTPSTISVDDLKES